MIQKFRCWEYTLRKPELKEKCVSQLISLHYNCGTYTQEILLSFEMEQVLASSNEVGEPETYLSA